MDRHLVTSVIARFVVNVRSNFQYYWKNQDLLLRNARNSDTNCERKRIHHAVRRRCFITMSLKCARAPPSVGRFLLLGLQESMRLMSKQKYIYQTYDSLSLQGNEYNYTETLICNVLIFSIHIRVYAAYCWIGLIEVTSKKGVFAIIIVRHAFRRIGHCRIAAL